jgi:hypothetical protein
MRYVTRFRIYPTEVIKSKIFHQFDVCTDLRNYCLDTKCYDVQIIPILKKEHPELNLTHANAMVLQNHVNQINYNARSLNKLKLKGKKIGKIRRKHIRSLDYEQKGFKIKKGTLYLDKIGYIKISLSRKVTIKVTIKRIG